MDIRCAKLEDLKRVSYITKLAWKVPYNRLGVVNRFQENEKIIDLFKKREMKILVAEVNNKIIGALRYQYKENKIYFFKLAVLVSYRKNGVGTALIKRLESEAKKIKIKEICLDVMEEKFLAPYYQKLGYKIINKVKHIDHHDIYMSKKI